MGKGVMSWQHIVGTTLCLTRAASDSRKTTGVVYNTDDSFRMAGVNPQKRNSVV
jgi:hypothetical protein